MRAVTLFNAQRVRAAGWYVDNHGHRLFLPAGTLAPICPHFGVVPVRWRLQAAIPPPLPVPPTEE